MTEPGESIRCRNDSEDRQDGQSQNGDEVVAPMVPGKQNKRAH